MELQFPSLADIYANVEGIKSARIKNRSNEMILANQERKQRTNEQIAPMLKNRDYTGAANVAYDAGDVETGQQLDTQESQRQGAASKLGRDKLATMIDVQKNLAPVLYQASQIPDPLARQKIVQSHLQEYGAYMEDIDPGWTERAMQKFGNADPNMLRIGAEAGLSRHDQLEAELKSIDMQEKRAESTRQQMNTDRSLAETARGHDIQREVGLGANKVAGGKQIFEAEQKLNADHQAESKTYVAVRDAFSRLKSALPSANKSSPATLAAATTFMKLLDPGSVVRETELGMALNSTGMLDKAYNYANTLANGKVLTKEQVKEFNDIAEKLYSAANKNQKMLNDQYRKKAEEYGMNPEHVVTNYNTSESQAVITQTSPSTGMKRISRDGGQTWQILR